MDEDLVIGGISVFVALCLVAAFGALSFDSSAVTARAGFDFGAVDGEAYNAPEMASFRAAVEKVSGLQALRNASESAESVNPLSKALAGVVGVNYADRKRLVLSLGAGSELFEAKAKALKEAERVRDNARFGALFLDGTQSVQARASVLSDRAAIAFGELDRGETDCSALMASSGLSTPNTALLESIALRLSPGAWIENCEAGAGLSEPGVALSLSRVAVGSESPGQKVVRLSGSVPYEEPAFEDLTDYMPPVIVAANQIKQLNADGGDAVYEEVFLPGRARIDFSKVSQLSGGAVVSLSVSAKGTLEPDGDYYVAVLGANAYISTRKLCEESCRFLVTVSSAPPVE